MAAPTHPSGVSVSLNTSTEIESATIGSMYSRMATVVAERCPSASNHRPNAMPVWTMPTTASRMSSRTPMPSKLNAPVAST